MPFKKGQSGNPKGNPGATKKQKQISEMLMHLVPDAVEQLESMLQEEDHREFAVKTILERVYGKPPQALELGAKEGVSFKIVIEGNE